MVQGTGAYSLPVIAQRLVGFLLLPLYTKYLTPADYGVLELLDQSFSLFAVLLGINYANSLAYHFFEHDSPAWRSQAVGTAMVGAGLMGAAATLVGVVLSTPFSYVVFGDAHYAPYFRLFAAATGLTFISEAGFAWLRVENRALLSSTIAILRIGVHATLAAFFLVVLQTKIVGILLSGILASFVAASILVAYWVRTTQLSFDSILFVRMIRYSIPIAVGSIALFVIHAGDRFVLQRYTDLSVTGIYALGYKIGMIIALIHGSFFAYWTAQVFQIAKREDSIEVIGRTFTYMMLALTFAALSLIVTTPAVLRILATPAFEPAGTVVPLIIAAYLCRAVGDFFRVTFYIKNRPDLDAKCNWIGALVCLVGYFALIPRYGMIGAAVATLITFIVIAVIALSWARPLMTIRLESARLWKIGATLGVLVAGFFMLPASSTATRILWAGVFIPAFPLTLWIIGFATPGEKTTLNTLAGALLQRLTPVP